MSLVSGAFELHSTTPDISMTTAMPGGHEPLALESSATAGTSDPSLRTGRPPLSRSLLQGSQAVTTELLSLLPPRDTAALLVDTYFDRVHWFMLIFHQEDFRQKWQTLYDKSTEDLLGIGPDVAMISTFLLVIAIALQYAGPYRQQLLKAQNVDLTLLKENILTSIRSRLLDIVSIGSIEAVQTCVLLGTYYLYNGIPNLAWPVCGCGLRVAQALSLHRKVPVSEPISAQARQKIETRKRCWWAIYEIETFCSISYGYPHGIVDADCNVEPLDPLPVPLSPPGTSNNGERQCPDTLLSYKYLMSKLSVFLKNTLIDLYGIGSRPTGNRKDQTLSFDLREILRKIPSLDKRLQQWKAELPDSLRLDQSNSKRYLSIDDMDRQIGASGPNFDSHIFQLQALALALAYENARILVHRPLLTYHTKVHAETRNDLAGALGNATRFSVQVCREAAMNTIKIGESPIFDLAADTYAAAFISIHTFTAGVLLCVLTSIEPLTPESHQFKVGLRRLLNMQAHLKSKSQSPLSAQGLEILQQLARLVMENELRAILGPGSESNLQLGGTMHHTSENPLNLNESQGSNLADNADLEIGAGDSTFADETSIQQALDDLNQDSLGDAFDMPLEPFFADFNVPSTGFTQEQAWIWGLEDPVQF
ncbi:fungal-specific transcription factor domain-containing protein [Penicillium argentinense]|uniref:Fungal-specific transcription factor domain-containing protein n=1 Tax=Penicillium argentinense TaxID=1131581 RepID=A0A9W9K312_9EURO|nr:fungal-specific transcription factor domain-containing protein [Penicillium argentinense]KAJ5090287.1 fungal-specific transcription factor domain-containing protein [Penicillium argentinense]